MQLNDYRHITTGADFAAAAPMMTSRLGARKGSPLGLNTTTPLLSTVHLDLAGEAERNFSPSIALVGELGAGKALATDTLIPTPSGWTAMGDLRRGDQVFDNRGRPTKVVGVSPIMLNRRCYRVVFSDGATIVADADHAWTTLPDRVRVRAAKQNYAVRRKGKGILKDLRSVTDSLTGESWPALGVTSTTEDIRTTLLRGAQANHAIPVTSPLDLPDADLPIDPYVLGAWLGDGTSSASHLTSADPEILDFVREAGYVVTALSAPLLYKISIPDRGYGLLEPVVARPCAYCGEVMTPRYRHKIYCSHPCAAAARRAGYPPAARGTCDDCTRELAANSTARRCPDCAASSTVRGTLRRLGVLNNKHIPMSYLRASCQQRRALLAGLLDTDGTVSRGGQVQVVLTNRRLAADTHELASSLGFRVTLRAGRATLEGRDCGPKWTICFTTLDKVFRLSRKVAAHATRTARSTAARHRLRYIIDVQEIPSVPVRCIRVAAKSRLFLVSESMIATHNSYTMKKSAATRSTGARSGSRSTAPSPVSGPVRPVPGRQARGDRRRAAPGGVAGSAAGAADPPGRGRTAVVPGQAVRLLRHQRRRDHPGEGPQTHLPEGPRHHRPVRSCSPTWLATARSTTRGRSRTRSPSSPTPTPPARWPTSCSPRTCRRWT